MASNPSVTPDSIRACAAESKGWPDAYISAMAVQVGYSLDTLRLLRVV